MSFWGATVITSLASAIPVVGDTKEISLTHVIFFFRILKLQQYPFEPQFGICESVTIIAWILLRAENIGCIEYWKV